MINPNATRIRYGMVTELKFNPHKGDTDLMVTLPNGQTLKNLGFLYPSKAIKVGDSVRIEIGFSIMSDGYVIRGVQRVTSSRVTGRFVEAVVGLAYKSGFRCEWSNFAKCFRINGSNVRAERALKAVSRG